MHYKEEEFQRGPGSQEVVEALISINNKLQQKEAAEGLLQYVMQRSELNIEVQVRWYEKLHNWNKALTLYEEKLQTFPTDEEASLGQMRYSILNFPATFLIQEFFL